MDGTVGLPEGCRSLVRLRFEAAVDDSPAFYPIVAFESETDDFPIGAQRDLYAEDLLARLDSEVLAYCEKSRPGLLNACRDIVREIERSRVLSQRD